MANELWVEIEYRLADDAKGSGYSELNSHKDFSVISNSVIIHRLIPNSPYCARIRYGVKADKSDWYYFPRTTSNSEGNLTLRFNIR